MFPASRYASLFAAAIGGVMPAAVLAETAPAARAVVSADAAPEAMSDLFTDFTQGERTLAVAGASWLQLQFLDVRLGDGGVLTIASPSGDSQSFSQAEIDAWGGLTAVFNGSEVRVTLSPAPGAEGDVGAELQDIIIGLSGAPATTAPLVVPQPLRGLLGSDAGQFLPDDTMQPGQEGVSPANPVTAESICGAADDRVAFDNPRAGRIMPIGCTGWLIDGGAFLTAGHCATAAAQTVEFNVPPSLANGTTMAPPVRDQYRITPGSMVSQNTGVGNDWAVFRTLPNTETGLTAAAAQGSTFQVSNTQNPGQVRIDGYGVDGPAPQFGAGGPRDTTNQTQQTHVGALSGNTGGATSGTLSYATDTQGGNSGSPVIVEGTATTIGIHTNGGCGAGGGTNSGTSFRNAALWAAVTAAQRGTADVVWQHINGQVHYWPMQGGQRQGGINISGLVGPEWHLVGAGDLDGDGTEDALWQHINGQVHYWPMLAGQRQAGIDIAGPVGPEWRLIGAGDLDGDRTDDVVWQHINGQVHYWPMLGGQRQGGIDIAGPVGPEWHIIGAGDLDGDGTDDVLWRHINGQVHYWPMLAGQRQGGFDIAGPVGPEWRIVDAGDVDGDGTEDVIWQHINGQVHYWPMLGGQRQGGIDIAGAVGPEWRIIAAGNLD